MKDVRKRSKSLREFDIEEVSSVSYVASRSRGRSLMPMPNATVGGAANLD